MKKLSILILLFLSVSCDDIIEVPDISNEIVTILAPTDGVTISATSITFNWNAVADAENYRLQIATPTFAEAQQIITDSLTTQLNLNIDLEAGAYQWRIRAENSEYQTAFSTQSFTVQ
ncbi:hypothetical protein DFQ05_2214 [Winogradskyella wandonensis]|uniref:Fibronectin type-III domain-containing protein n=1 Tax=Winogradskyella wandonensis TaxID=1442586 RepID=A0A4R1KJS7_9FLAO|nr:hypothetical protein [Winogradskyella wandonensis]TCK65002.1 hypothetical protein DFQ05_2214 [Winogradskyella wandonensis]